MKIHITPQNIRETCERALALLGEDFVQSLRTTPLSGFSEMKGGRQENREQVQESSRQELNAHPLAIWLRDLGRDLVQIERVSRLALSDNSVAFLNLVGCLIEGAQIDNVDECLRRLRERDHFFSAAYELHVACSYQALGYRVRFVVEEDGKRTPDLVVEKDGHQLQVECKSTADESRQQHHLFVQLAVRLDREMERLGRSVHLKISPRYSLSGFRVDCLFREIKKCLEDGSRPIAMFGDGVQLHWSDFESTPFVKTWGLDGIKATREFRGLQSPMDSGFVALASKKSPSGPFEWYVDGASEIRNYVEVDLIRSLRSKYKKASKQLAFDHAAIVHIQLPHESLESFLDIVDANRNELRDEVLGPSKVRALVLESRAIDRHRREGGPPTIAMAHVISNVLARVAVPQELQIAGTIDLGVPFHDDEGTFASAIRKQANPEGILGRPLLAHSAPHGDRQFVVWTRKDGRLRLELTALDGTFRVVEKLVDWNSLPEDPELFGTWSPGSLTIDVVPGESIREDELGEPIYRRQFRDPAEELSSPLA